MSNNHNIYINHRRNQQYSKLAKEYIYMVVVFNQHIVENDQIMSRFRIKIIHK